MSPGQTLGLFLLMLGAASAAAQPLSTSELARAERARTAIELRAPVAELETALEAPVDTETYRLVPGDRLLLGIWGERAETYQSAVTPDGYLVVPDLVGVSVAGLTLAAGETRVRDALRNLYPPESVRLHLLALGHFRVGLTGAVPSPGFYEVSGASRLTDLLVAGGGLRPESGIRRLRIRRTQEDLAAARVGGERTGDLEVDLTAWFLRGELDSNPRLEPGWIIEVPVRETYVEVGGAVSGPVGIRMEAPEPVRPDPNRPAEPEWVRVEWKPGDRIGDAVGLAGGLGEAATGFAWLHEGSGPVRLDLRDPADLARPVGAFAQLEVEHAARWVYVVGAVRVPGRYPYYAGLGPEDYVLLAGGETENGRSEGWKLILPDGTVPGNEGRVVPGSTLRVPERRSYWLSRVLAPVTSAAALALSIIALNR